MKKAPHPFTSIDQQIDILKKRDLTFRSIDNAKTILSMYGYYNIINGYKDNYVDASSNNEKYKEGSSFEQIYSLFSLDHEIRNTIMAIMIDMEEMLRSTVSYIVGAHCGYLKDDYLDIRKYRNNQKKNPRFSLKNILKALEDAYYSGKDPIKYNREMYGNVPPWVLLKGVYFSTIVNYVGFFKAPMKAELISTLYGIPEGNVSSDVKQLFSDSLLMFLEYRNLCAHGGRIYNHCPIYYIRKPQEAFETDSIFGSPCEALGIGQLIAALGLFSHKQYNVILSNKIEESIKAHCKSYPEDLPFLLNAMHVEQIIHIDLSN